MPTSAKATAGRPGASSARGNCGGAPTAIRGPGHSCQPVRSVPKTPGAKTRTTVIITSRSGSAAGQGGDRLTRDDHLYDFIIEIDHNAAPRVAGRGSAVFLHLARSNFAPTAGCVSMTKSSMLRLLRRIGPQTRIIIG